MPGFLENWSSYVAPWTLVIDALFVLLIAGLCLLRHFHPLVVLRELLDDARPLVGLFFVILFVFVNLYTVAEYLGGSFLPYGTFTHFFNVFDQQEEMRHVGSAAFFIACTTAIAGNFLLSGVFVSVLVNVFDSMIARVRHGLVSPRIYVGSVAILGYRPGVTETLLLQLYKEKEKKTRIILLTEQEVPKLKLTLRVALPDGIWKRLTLVHGGWAEMEDLRRLRLYRCCDIYLLGEEGEENHDSLSLKALDAIQHLLAEQPREEEAPKPACHILWEEWDFINLMLTSDIARFVSSGKAERLYDIRTYHPHSMLAKNVLIAKGWHAGDNTLCPPLDRVSFLRESGRRVHFIIIGMSQFGRALLRATLLQAHYPNYAQDKSRRSLISIIDPQAEAEMERLRNQHPLYFSKVRYEHRSLAGDETARRCWNEGATLLDTELHFISGLAETQRVRDFLVQACAEPGDVVTVAVCRTDSALSLKTAMHLPVELRAKGIPVYVYQSSEENLLRHNINIRRQAERAGGLESTYQKKYDQTSAACSNLYPVGSMERIFELHTADFSLPRLFHRIYSCTSAQIKKQGAGQVNGLARFVQLCREAESSTYAPPKTLQDAGSGASGIWSRFFTELLELGDDGDASGKEMEKLPLILHWSNRYLAEAQERCLRQYPAPQGESMEEQWKSVLHWLPLLREAEHQRWMAERLLNEDPLGKMNPNIAPLEELPEEMQHYDAFLCLASYLIAERG